MAGSWPLGSCLPDVGVEVGPTLQLTTRDTVVLASDGLFDNLYIDEIVESICTGPLAAAANRHVERVKERMSAGAHERKRPCRSAAQAGRSDGDTVPSAPLARNHRHASFAFG